MVHFQIKGDAIWKSVKDCGSDSMITVMKLKRAIANEHFLRPGQQKPTQPFDLRFTNVMTGEGEG